MHELRYVDPRRMAQVLAIVYAVLFTLLTLFTVPMFLFMPAEEFGGNPPPKAMLFLLLLYPLLGAGMGWLTGYVVSRVYNFVARRFGGVLIEVKETVLS